MDRSSRAAVGKVRLDSAVGRYIIVTTVTGSAVAQLTATVVNVALPTLADSLDATSSQQQWVINAYTLTLASLILLGGSLGDRFGRLRIYRIGVIWFALASLLCAVAPNINVLIGARLLQGMGGALLTPGSLAIIEATLRPGDRSKGVGRWSGLGGIASAIGPLVGGVLVGLSWRWVFLLNLPLAVLVIATSAKVPESLDPEARKHALDVGGAILTTAALAGSTFALIQGPSDGWTTLDIAAAGLAFLAFIGLVGWEPRAAAPMVPIRLFARREFAAANLITFLVYGGMGVVFFLLSIQLQVTAGFSPVAAGASMLPVTLLMFFLSPRVGQLSDRIGPRWPLTAGTVLIALGLVLFRRVGPGAEYVLDVLPAVLVFGLGLSLSVTPVTSAALGSVPSANAGAASGTNNAVSRTGQLLAVAAIPPLVGLTGSALSDPVALNSGFRTAMLASSGLVLLGSVTAFFGLRAASVSPSSDRAGSDGHSAAHHYDCPVDGTHSRARATT